MQTINREKITRYFTQKESTGSGGSGSDSGDLIAWVNDNFVSKNFFNQLFTIHGHDEDDTSTPPEDVIVTPNDTQTIIDSIEAMFDFYSEKAISALGLNSQGGGGGASTLADLNDVDLTTPTNGQVLMYNSTTGKWYNGTVQGGGGGTVTSIVAGTGLSGGTITTSGTIALSSETQTDIGNGVTAYGWGNHANAGYLTSSDISDMATQTWVGQNYLGLHSTADKATKLATARTLWGQSFDGTANVTGSLTDVTNITGSGTLHRFTSMELNSQGDLSGYGGYIDYHYNGGGTDYTSRLVEESVGVLTLKSKSAADVTTLAGLIVGAAVDGSFVQVGSVRLVYDSTNNAIKVVGSDGTTAANLYATGAVSALGANSQSGGGGLTMDDVWDALGNGSGPDGGRQINASHVSYALFGYATQTWVNNQSFAKGVKVGSTTYSPDSNGIVDLGTISSTDTKNTVGSTTLNATQLYLVITSAPASGGTYTQSYINTNCYIGTDNCLYSNGTKVLTSETYKGTVTGIAIGSGSPYTPTNGIVGLPAYPSKTSDLTNDSGFITGYTDTKNTAGTTDKPNTKLFLVGAESQGANPQTYSNSSCYINTNNQLVSGGNVVATTSDLGSYLPLTGGTMSNTNLVGNLNAQLFNGHYQSYFYSRNDNTLSDNLDYNALTFDLVNDGIIVQPVHQPNYTGQTNYPFGGYGTMVSFIGNYTQFPFRIAVRQRQEGFYYECATYQRSDWVGGVWKRLLQNGDNISLLNNDAGYLTSASDTKDTAGNQDLYSSTAGIMMYLVGVTSKGSAAGSYTTSYVNQKCYIGTDNCLYSDGTKVLTSETYKGTVTGVAIGGGNPYTPTNGIVGLPAYPTVPTKVSQLTNDSGFVTSDTKNTTGTTNLAATKLFLVGATEQSTNPVTYSNINCYINTSNQLVSNGSVVATTADLGSYLPLTGGTMSNTNLVGNLNAQLFNGHYQSYFYSTNNNTQGNNVDYNALTFDVANGIIIQPVHQGNYTGQTNYPFAGYGSMVSFICNNTTGFPFRIAVKQNQGGFYYECAPWTHTDWVGGVWKRLLQNGDNISLLNNDAGYLTSGDVVTVATDQTITGKKTFTTQFTTNGNAALTKGAKFYSICVETNSSGAFDSAREGEINRFGSNDLHLQYASGTGGVTLCQNKLKFSLVQGVVNMTTNSAALYLNTGSTAPTTAVAWSTTSDIRRKDVIRNVDARIEQIAEAPIFDYYLKGGDNGQPFLGTSAQYWLGVFPNAVRMGYDSFYGQDYGATALAAAVITARKVVNHEERIAALERENEELRKELELLKAA